MNEPEFFDRLDQQTLAGLIELAYRRLDDEHLEQLMRDLGTDERESIRHALQQAEVLEGEDGSLNGYDPPERDAR